jgi:hypothetical protein
MTFTSGYRRLQKEIRNLLAHGVPEDLIKEAVIRLVSELDYAEHTEEIRERLQQEIDSKRAVR